MESPTARPDSSIGKFAVAALLTAFVAAVIFLPATRNGYTNWDDTSYVRNEANRSGIDGLRSIWSGYQQPQYYPLTFTLYWLQHQVWQDHARGYHAVGVALHALNAAVVVLFLGALGLSAPAAAAGGVLFALAPPQTMSVAWIAEQKNLLSTFFGLLSMLAFVRFFRRPNVAAYTTGAVLFIAALLSKTSWLVLPVIVFLTATIVQRAALRRALAATLPLLCFSLAAAAQTWLFERQYAEPDTLPLASRLLIAPGAILWYAKALLVPRESAPFHPLWDLSPAGLSVWGPGAALAALAIALIAARRVIPPLVTWGILSFVVFLAPMLGIVAYGNIEVTWVSDHYLYYAAIPFFAAGCAIVVALLRRLGVGTRVAIGVVLTSAAGLAFAAQTTRSIPAYLNESSFWNRAVEAAPHTPVAYIGRALANVGDGALDAAAADLRKAIALRPTLMQARFDLVAVFMRQRNFTEAAAELDAMLREDPRNVQAIVRYGALELAREELQPALTRFDEALAIDPGDEEAIETLVTLCLRMNDINRALLAATRAAEANPNSAVVQRVFGAVLDRSGQVEAAEAAFRRSLALNADNAELHYGLGVSLFRQRKYDEALAHYSTATELDGTRANYWNNWGCALLELGRYEAAAEKLRRALDLDPQDSLAWNNLGSALERSGRRAEAIDCFESAVRLEPAYARAHQRLVQALMDSGLYFEAVERLSHAATLIPGPERLGMANQMARIRAASPDNSLRDPALAVRIAESLVRDTEQKSFEAYDTLAIARAANAEFDKAIEAIDRAIEIAAQFKQTALIDEYRARRALFESGTAYLLPDIHQPSKPDTPATAPTSP